MVRWDSARRRWADRLVMYRRGAWQPVHWRYRGGGGGSPERYARWFGLFEGWQC